MEAHSYFKARRDITFWKMVIEKHQDGMSDSEIYENYNITKSGLGLYKRVLIGEEVKGSTHDRKRHTYSKEEQLRIIDEYRKWTGTMPAFVDKYNIAKNTLRVLKLRYLSEENTIKTVEEKVEITKSWIRSGLTRTEFAEENGIEFRNLFVWAKKYHIAYARGSNGKLSEAEELRRKRQYELAVHKRVSRHEAGTTRTNDLELNWVKTLYPELEPWREEAEKWIKMARAGHFLKLTALGIFFEHYLLHDQVNNAIDEFFLISTELPSFVDLVYKKDKKRGKGTQQNNILVGFLSIVLHSRYPTVSMNKSSLNANGLHNPFTRLSRAYEKRSESVYSPLPYGYIVQLRNILVEGPNFRDWVFAQKALLSKNYEKYHQPTAAWYQVVPEDIDESDPDCVWRIRKLADYRGGDVYEMWSPVRWVCLLAKLYIPIRNMQARLLDSGESDTWRFVNGKWKLNKNIFARGNPSKPHQQGVFRRMGTSIIDKSEWTALYINTNKTADTYKTGSDLGYVMEWQNDDLIYWLEKMRNWQEKYNPIDRPLSWLALDERHVKGAVAAKLQKYPEACFLFRTPERDGIEKQFPLTSGSLNRVWFELLYKLQNILEERNERHADNSAIKFVPDRQYEYRRKRKTTYFPLHSIRVSLISSLAFEGKVPFPILSRLVGHSRMIMTLYYAKPGREYSNEVLKKAEQTLEENKESSIVSFLRNSESEALIMSIVANSSSAIEQLIPKELQDRNAAGWMMLHHGLCLAGGNTSNVATERTLAGCFNGGEDGGLVTGGVRNCIRCKWYITQPSFLPALVAHFNGLAYQLDEARNLCQQKESQLIVLKRERRRLERLNQYFEGSAQLVVAQRNWEVVVDSFCLIAENLSETYNKIERCRKLLYEETSNNGKFLINSRDDSVRILLEETSSELLQLSGICEDMEQYADLVSEKPILRRSQILDHYLYNTNQKPIFLFLSIEEQLKVGNEYIKTLSDTNIGAGKTGLLANAIDIVENSIQIDPAGGNATSLITFDGYDNQSIRE